MKLAAKLALSLTAATVLLCALFAVWIWHDHQRDAERMIALHAEGIGDIIRRGTRYQMMRNDREALYQSIRDIGSEPGMHRVRIFNKQGQISFSTDPGEINHAVNKRAEACYGCHAQEEPLQKLNRADRMRIFTEKDGTRILATILPIENQPDCSNAACHAHPPDQTVLGVIDTQLSLAQVDREQVAHRSLMLRFTVAAIVLMCLVSILFVWAVVYRPVRDLMAGVTRASSGDLSGEIPVRSRDEIGDLARRFNQMTADLRTAQKEVTEWAHTLEQRVEAETRALEQAHRSLLQSEKLAAVGKLAATVAHEINNPLFGILTSAKLARRQLEQCPATATEEARRLSEKLAVIERESHRCGEIVKNLLMFSRQAPTQMEPVRLDTAIERAMALVRHSYQLQNIELEVGLDDGGAVVRGDLGQLQQVLLAILVNAADAMPQGGRVAVTTETAGSKVRVRIRDNGPGIPAEILPRIFEPFFTTKEDRQRTGLGLAIASGIIEQHGGSIGVSSSAREGTEFRIELPLVQVPVGAKP